MPKHFPNATIKQMCLDLTNIRFDLQLIRNSIDLMCLLNSLGDKAYKFSSQYWKATIIAERNLYFIIKQVTRVFDQI